MIQKLALTLLAWPVLLLVPAAPALAASPAAPVFADSVSDACSGIGLTGGNCNSDKGANRISSVIKSIINVLSAIVGVAAVIMIIIGGFKYITSGGDATKVSGAKNTIVYAIVGLLVVAFAQVLVHFVIKSAS